MTETSACKNCGTLLTGNFCHSCGQKSDIHRITLKHLLHEFFHALTHADKGILFLAKEMVYRPGYVAKEYIEGKRKKYFNPLSFLVIVSAVFAIVSMNSRYFEAMGSSNRDYSRMPEQYALYMTESMDIIVHHGKLISLIVMVPVLTFLSWIFFRKRNHNFAENLVLQSLIIGQIHLAMVVVFIPAYLLFGHPNLNNTIFQITFLFYMTIAYQQFFGGNIFVSFIKSLFIQLLFIILFWLLIGGFVIVRHLF